MPEPRALSTDQIRGAIPSVHLTRAEFDLWLKWQRAEAWDQGFKQGGPMHDDFYGEPDRHKINPYRSI